MRRLRRLRRLCGLTATDRRLLAEACVRLFVVTMALRLVGYGRLSRWVPGCAPRSIRAEHKQTAVRYAFWIRLAARAQPFEALCLAQSVTLHAWLRGQGIPSHLKIGVVKAGAQLAAHAWVELDGTPVNDSQESIADFTPLGPRRPLGTLHQLQTSAAN